VVTRWAKQRKRRLSATTTAPVLNNRHAAGRTTACGRGVVTVCRRRHCRNVNASQPPRQSQQEVTSTLSSNVRPRYWHRVCRVGQHGTGSSTQVNNGMGKSCVAPSTGTSGRSQTALAPTWFAVTVERALVLYRRLARRGMLRRSAPFNVVQVAAGMPPAVTLWRR